MRRNADAASSRKASGPTSKSSARVASVSAMTILKWVLIAVALVYFGGLAALFLLQRSFLFPIPPVARTTPAAAGFPQAEEHVLDTSDGEKVVLWHVSAKPGHPIVLY